MRSRDLWFRPIETRIGPDGALYVVDFYNQAVIHNDTRGPLHGPANAAVRPDRDHGFGRIYRIQHKEAKRLEVPVLDRGNLDGLIRAMETSPNAHVKMQAWRLARENHASSPRLQQIARPMGSQALAVYERARAATSAADTQGAARHLRARHRRLDPVRHHRRGDPARGRLRGRGVHARAAAGAGGAGRGHRAGGAAAKRAPAADRRRPRRHRGPRRSRSPSSGPWPPRPARRQQPIRPSSTRCRRSSRTRPRRRPCSRSSRGGTRRARCARPPRGRRRVCRVSCRARPPATSAARPSAPACWSCRRTGRRRWPLSRPCSPSPRPPTP